MFGVNVVDLRFDVFYFVAKKQASQKGSLFCLKFAMHILPAKPRKVSLKRVLISQYFSGFVIFTDSSTVILSTVIAQYNININISQIRFELINFN